MRRWVSGLMAVGVLATASGALAAEPPNPAGEAQLAKLLEGRVAGKPVSCLRLSDIQGSEIIDGTAIVYHLPGNRLYVNRPRGGASSLRQDDVLVTRTYGGDLCEPDAVDLFDSLAHFQRGFVSLGPFVPYSKPAR